MWYVSGITRVECHARAFSVPSHVFVIDVYRCLRIFCAVCIFLHDSHEHFESRIWTIISPMDTCRLAVDQGGVIWCSCAAYVLWLRHVLIVADVCRLYVGLFWMPDADWLPCAVSRMPIGGCHLSHIVYRVRCTSCRMPFCQITLAVCRAPVTNCPMACTACPLTYAICRRTPIAMCISSWVLTSWVFVPYALCLMPDAHYRS